MAARARSVRARFDDTAFAESAQARSLRARMTTAPARARCGGTSSPLRVSEPRLIDHGPRSAGAASRACRSIAFIVIAAMTRNQPKNTVSGIHQTKMPFQANGPVVKK